MHLMVSKNWLRFNEPFEGIVDHMYVDQKGWVTTGVGNKIDETPADPNTEKSRNPTPEDRERSLPLAYEIQWQDKASNTPATQTQVAEDWDAVKARFDLIDAPDRLAVCKRITHLRIPPKEISRIVEDKVGKMENFLLTIPEFSDFQEWPANAQVATLSMSWAMGGNRINLEFPKFKKHIVKHDWAAAAGECRFSKNEGGTVKIRNDINEMYFQMAADVKSGGHPFEKIAISLYELRGVQHGLWMLGYKTGPQNGKETSQTRTAVEAFQKANQLPTNGNWTDTPTLERLEHVLIQSGWTVF